MADRRLPLKIRPLPGGFAIEFADKRQAIIVYGREPHVARAANALTLDEAKTLAQDVARALTEAWRATDERDDRKSHEDKQRDNADDSYDLKNTAKVCPVIDMWLMEVTHDTNSTNPLTTPRAERASAVAPPGPRRAALRRSQRRLG